MFGNRAVGGELMEETAELRRMLNSRRAGDDAEMTPGLLQELEELRRISAPPSGPSPPGR